MSMGDLFGMSRMRGTVGGGLGVKQQCCGSVCALALTPTMCH